MPPPPPSTWTTERRAASLDDDVVAVQHTDDQRSAALLPHRGSQYLFRVCPWTQSIPVVGAVLAAFGPTFTASLGAFSFMNNGLADNLIAASTQPMMMNRYGIDGTRYQRLAGVVAMGSSTKPLIAVVSDIFPIFHYRKRWYQLGSCVVGAAVSLAYALLPARPASADTAAALIFLSTFCRMNSDVLTQGHYTRLLRRTPQAGPVLVTWIYYMILTAKITSALIIGPLADRGVMHYGIMLSAAMHLLPSFIFIFNGYGEAPNRTERLEDARMLREDVRAARRQAAALTAHDAPTPEHPPGETAVLLGGLPKREDGVKDGLYDATPVCAVEATVAGDDRSAHPPRVEDVDLDVAARAEEDEDEDEEEGEECVEWDVDQATWRGCDGHLQMNHGIAVQHWRVIAYSALMISCVVTMAAVTIMGTVRHLLWASIAVSVACIAAAFVALPCTIAKAAVAVYLDTVLYVQLPGALDSFFVASGACVPGGPQFTYTLYTTVGAIVQNVAGLAGITVFAYVLSRHSFQRVMAITVIMRVVATTFDLMVVERWNVHVGIPDEAMYICGDSVISQICYQLNYMTVVLLLSRVCPRGSESMTFAIMSGIEHLGMTMSNTVGSLLMELVWPIDTTSRPCDYSNVRWLLIAGRMGTPLLMVPLSFVLLPRARLCDNINVNDDAIRRHTDSKHSPPVETNASPSEPVADARAAPRRRR
ncbi:putative pteridine transporter [Novymonas esmeraldas]|uniref:Pteridine transporter n=1 Tax=Novymonas esmeraldas TaxID=1808958 RepID=A0AAW0ETP2_9TRYP